MATLLTMATHDKDCTGCVWWKSCEAHQNMEVQSMDDCYMAVFCRQCRHFQDNVCHDFEECN